MTDKILLYISRIAQGMLIVVLLLVILTVGISIMGVDESLFGGKLYRVVTSSMEPTFSVGDYIVVEKVAPKDVREGDIVLYPSNDAEIAGQPVAHRVIHIEEEDGRRYFHVKGDAASEQDVSVIDETALRSRVIQKSRFATVAGKILYSPWTYVPAVILPLFALIGIRLWQGIRRRHHKVLLKKRILAAGLDPKDEKLLELIKTYGDDIIERISFEKKQ